MRGRVHARRTLKGLVADLRYIVKSSRTLARASAQILNECDKAVFVVTGDIVDKGNVSNYQWAKKMFKDFQDEIEKEDPNC